MAKSYFWACDFNEISGEGKLAKLYIEYQKKITNKNFEKIKQPKNYILNYKYISPIIGIIICWIYYLKKKEVYYVNYLPLWNTLIFAFLPPKTKLGPITGGAEFNKKNNFIRAYLFPIFYKLSEYLINIREHRIFSTDLLKKHLSKNTISKSTFNYIFNFVKKNKIHNKKKDIDFLIYNRVHKNQKKQISKKTINKLMIYGFKIVVIGDKINLPKIKNYGFISNKKVKNLLNRTLFTIPSEENLFSLFVIECIENNVKILVNSDLFKKIKFYKSYFIKFDQKNFDNLKIYKKKLI